MLERRGDGLRASRTLRAGESGGVVLESMGGQPRRITGEELDRLQRETADFWRAWVHRSTYTGRWREMVTRSAITLKLMIYAPTGAPIAAPTTGLPEQVGGERNWDYRYTWIRDGSFSLYALLGLGYVEEARAFARWMRQRVAELKPGAEHPLNIMYRVDGSSDLVEEILDHFEGWRGSKPVRIGNGAADQLQLDIYGEMLDAAYLGDVNGMAIYTEGWEQVSRLIDWLCDHWDQPDEGIWETRGGRKDFTYGRFQCWIAFDRAIRMAAHRGRPADLARWTKARDDVFRQIMSRGWNAKVGAFTQHYTTEVLDSSLLMMPLQGFIPAEDPMWLSTLNAMDKELVSDSLVYRYNPSASPDGLAGDEGTFSLCTFWYVDALARAGRTRRRPADVREDAHLRQPPRAVLRGDQQHRRAAWQLPAGVQPPGADQRRHQPRPRARPRGQRAKPSRRSGDMRVSTGPASPSAEAAAPAGRAAGGRTAPRLTRRRNT